MCIGNCTIVVFVKKPLRSLNDAFGLAARWCVTVKKHFQEVMDALRIFQAEACSIRLLLLKNIRHRTDGKEENRLLLVVHMRVS